MPLAAALEIVVVVLVWRAPNVLRRAGLLLWIGSVFLVYHIGLWWIGFEGSCRCLGNVGDVFGISAETADWIAKGILASFRCITRAQRSIGCCGQSWRLVCHRVLSGRWW